MMKKVLLCACFICAIPTIAQVSKPNETTNVTTDIQSMHSVNLHILPLGLSYAYERKITPLFSAGVRPYFVVGGYDRYSGLLLQAGIDVEGRYYYNRAKRASQGKALFSNAGNFLGASFRYGYVFFPSSSVEVTSAHLVHFPAIFWGMRRPLGKHVLFELTLGVQYRIVEKVNNYLQSEVLWDGVIGGGLSNIYPYIAVRFGANLN